MDSTSDPFAGFNPLDFAGVGETGGTPTDLTASVGPQSDGTYSYPSAAQPNNQPWDTSGNANGNYAQPVLDILKFGVGVAQQQSAQNAFYDYKRFEATNGGLFLQGRYAGVGTGGMPLRINPAKNGTLLLLIALGAILLIKAG